MSAAIHDDVVPPVTSSLPALDTKPIDDRPVILRALSGPAAPSNGLPNSLLEAHGAFTDSPLEADDYINGGLPHDDPSPANGGIGDVPNSRAPATSASPRRTLAARGSGHSDATPTDGVSPGRRSVQFARTDVVLDSPMGTHTRNDSWDGVDASGKSRGERLMSKLKALAATGALQTTKPPNGSEQAVPSTSTSPNVPRSNRIPQTLNEEGSDADVDESGDEEPERPAGKVNRRKRMRRRLRNLDLLSAPTTPRPTGEVESPSGQGRFNKMVRRSTMPDSSEHRAGLSEGEGRDHLTGPRRVAWGRGSSWMGNPRLEAGDEVESPQGRGPGHRRRISDMFATGGGGVSDGDVLATPRRPLFGADRATTFGAQRWKQVKNTFKMLGKKKTDQFDYMKSAELMAELRAVTPAVMMLASMLQRDEHGNKRIPVLLEQVNLRVVDSQPSKGDKEKGHSERHWLFNIALEYGSGPSRMSWVVERSIRDMYNLHLRYKLSVQNNEYLQSSSTQRNRPKQPSFPSKAFPWLRGFRGLGDSDDEDRTGEGRGDETAAEVTAGEMTAAEGTASEIDRPSAARRKKSRMHLLGVRRQSTGLAEVEEGSVPNIQRSAMEAVAMRRKFVERQRKVVEKYLQEMIHWLMFRADSNRLCRFLELSALGVRLAAEGTYHGKECFLHIQSSKGIDFRRVLTPAKVIARHSRKWFLVRQNYIVVAESPSTMNIYDVYLVDPHFRIVAKKSKLKRLGAKAIGDKEKGKGKASDPVDDQDEVGEDDSSEKHHTLKIYTSERKIKLFSRNQNLMRQFEQSVTEMLKQTAWHERHRFDSFAPVRTGVFAQWLVDGRDYMWNVSRAISMAQDVIYIHDWWLSPELYMRRPAAISQKWRLDRLLQRKAREGVKVFVIIYRNVEQAIPIDSEYTKFSLLNLHPNIMVQRSPNQLKKNQFFYAHHEKICIVDHDVAFVGGVDLCFGRWDTPQHPLRDDHPTGFEPGGETPKDAEHCQLFPGKDYSNPRVLDFFKLNEPYEEMYDRSKVPRMPWHDIAMQVVGQPARDLTRHFIQRWNYLRRERKPTRPTPFLLPPPDATRADLEHVGLTGTCEVQILRSGGDWSLGFPKDQTEQSIQSAYVKLIEQSEHFVYIENQFFITSTETMNTKVVNRIGDALVERIIRAAEKDEDWKCCIVIPLMPGFQNTVEQDSGSSVRLIMQFQYRSICRGPNSIFGRLQAAGIDPEEYIQFFSLRQWGKIGNNQIVTEQLYIHAKTIIVDDRTVLIGSANINERSMLGNRDSECAAIVRDTDMIWSEMAGKPYRVGRFAHSLRMRLMREHLGLDVDEITEEERQAAADLEAQYEAEMKDIYSEDYDTPATEAGPSSNLNRPNVSHGASFNNEAAATEDRGFTSSSSSSSSSSTASKGKSPERDPDVIDLDKQKADVDGVGADHWKDAHDKGVDQGRDSMVIGGREVLISKLNEPAKPAAHAPSLSSSIAVGAQSKSDENLPPAPDFERRTTTQLGLPHLTKLPDLPVTDDVDIGGPGMRLDDQGKPTNDNPNPLAADIQLAHIDKDCMRDPVDPKFWDEVWNRVSANNTKLYRRVFRCMPDSEVLTWGDYKEYNAYSIRFHESMSGSKKPDDHDAKSQNSQAGGAAAGISAPSGAQEALGLSEKLQSKLKPDLTPKLVVSNGDGAFDEKLGLPRRPQTENAKPNLNLDTEKVNRHPPIDAPSPVQPAGDTPFPVYDGQADSQLLEPQATHGQNPKPRDRRTTFSSQEKPASSQSANPPSTIYSPPANAGSTRRRRRATTKGSGRRGPIFPYDVLSRDEAEELCNMIQGTLVQFPYDWLESEEKDNHWLFQADLLAPKEIYD